VTLPPRSGFEFAAEKQGAAVSDRRFAWSAV
jgi:hypothetical protein